MNLYIKCISSGIWKATILVVMVWVGSIIVIFNEGIVSASLLLNPEVHIRFWKSSVVITTYIVSVISFSALSIVKRREDNCWLRLIIKSIDFAERKSNKMHPIEKRLIYIHFLNTLVRNASNVDKNEPRKLKLLAKTEACLHRLQAFLCWLCQQSWDCFLLWKRVNVSFKRYQPL